MEELTRVVLAVEGHDVAEEVMHFLDRGGSAHVVATAEDGRQLEEAVRQLEPQAVVASPSLAVSSPSMNGSVYLALDTRESVQTLRRALSSGARGFYLWPGDRDGLAAAIRRLRPAGGTTPTKRARIVAVYAPRGGAGGTFIASHLAASFGRSAKQTVLVGLDPLFGDVAAALGVGSAEEVRTIADVAPLADQLSSEHLEGVLWSHRDGFRALLPPTDAQAGAELEPEHVRGVLDVLAGSVDTVVLDVPRGLGPVARAGLSAADRIVVVLSLDVFSFRAAKRALDVVEEFGAGDVCLFVVNRARRAEVTPGDVERVFGKPAVAVIPFDPRVPQAQDRGRLVRARSRVGRAVDRLAGAVSEGAS